MNRLGRAGLLLALGAIAARLLWTGDFGLFVQQRMRWPLMAAAVVLVVFGLYEATKGGIEERDHPEAAKQSTGAAVGWLLLLPLVVLISVAPAGLGAAASTRVAAFNPTATGQTFEPLPATEDSIDMRVYDFVDRALWDSAESLEGRTVRLEGLVVNDPTIPDGFRLTKFLVSCCAADGIPLQVGLRDVGQSIEDDLWVVVDVEWIRPATPYAESGKGVLVEAEVVTVESITDTPNDPYESPY